VALITESTTAFTEASQLIKQLRIPYSLLIAAMAWRNLLILGHHLVVLAIAALLFGASPGAGAPLALLGVALTTAAGLAAGLILAIICARYRDLQPLAGSVLQIAFFVTPVFWRPEQLGADARLIVGLNPLHHFLDVMRAPILGSGPALESWLAAVAMTLALWVVAIWLFARTRERIAYWV
jgi:ABC-type polysaccharide/polyol phosphate export permease